MEENSINIIPIIFWSFVIFTIISKIIKKQEKEAEKNRMKNKLEQQNKLIIQPIAPAELPQEVTYQLLSNETVYYFSYINIQDGGCMSSGSSALYWIALSDKRILYKSKIKENDNDNTKLTEKNGIIPFDKISGVEITHGEEQGCSNTEYYQLRVSNSGGAIIIPILTELKGFEIRKAYMELLNKENIGIVDEDNK